MRGTLVAVMVGILAWSTLAGCSGEDVSQPNGGKTAKNAADDGYQGILPPLAYPLAPYRMSVTDSMMITWAARIISDRCMRKFGFEPEPFEIDMAKYKMIERNEAARRFGVTDPKIAKKFGYGRPGDYGKPADRHPMPSKSYLFVLTGAREPQPQVAEDAKSPGTFGGLTIPPGGCAGEGRKAIWGTPSNVLPFHLGRELAVKAALAAESDPEWIEADQDWSECMKSAGYVRTDPNHFPPSRVPETLETPGVEPSPAEVQEALADISCKRKVHYVKRRNANRVEYEQREVEANQLALDEEKKLRDAGLRRAAAIVAEAEGRSSAS